MMTKRLRCHTLGVFCHKKGYYYSLYDRHRKIMHTQFIAHSDSSLGQFASEIKSCSYCHVLLDSSYYHAEVMPVVAGIGQKKLFSSLKWKAREISPWENEPIVYQFTRLPSFIAGENDILLYVTKKHELERIRQYFFKMGLLLSSISPLEQAIYNASVARVNEGVNIVFYLSGDEVRALILNQQSIVYYLSLPVPNVAESFSDLVGDVVRANVIATSWQTTLNDILSNYDKCNVYLLENHSSQVEEFFIKNNLASSVIFLFDDSLSGNEKFPHFCLQGVV